MQHRLKSYAIDWRANTKTVLVTQRKSLGKDDTKLSPALNNCYLTVISVDSDFELSFFLTMITLQRRFTYTYKHILKLTYFAVSPGESRLTDAGVSIDSISTRSTVLTRGTSTFVDICTRIGKYDNVGR